ncbi:MAG: NADH-quinone oxidoreductase subunit NuoE [Bacteroidales bacterium]|nr:NADH-quinone oxidoreductase subunit NuoE [Bacteroidales bacterium]HOY38102.1 NADH-quinone oxidoreductase subunit NuoE [Bacteroidales bacterium]HQP04482.1 NADH-quinone oxidoreductase subunit NuoE [Bacteroidales bacterium]
MRIKRIYADHSQDKQLDALVITNELDEVIGKYKNKKGSIIPILQSTQAIFGYLPRAAFDKIAKETGLEVSDMYGVATFYTQFRLNPVGKNIIKVCHGTACHVQNANAVGEALAEELHIKDGETTPDGLFTLESVACLGCCSLAPVMMVNNNTYGKLDGKSAVKVIREISKKAKTNSN